ncbi:MAG: hypothetical protein K5650_07955 [Bacteroidales bacterium]|nr:hypothetical protein [Bacteroidales bacterium]
MNKICKTLALAAIAFAAVPPLAAQDPDWRITYDVAAGLTHYRNYSGLSLRPDAQSDYTAMTSQFTLGVEHKRLAFGVRYSNTGLNTSAIAIDERATVQEVSLLLRAKVELTPRLEMLAGASVGYMGVTNRWNDGNRGYSVNRGGMTLGTEIELRYRLSRSISLIARAGMNVGDAGGGPSSLPDASTMGTRTTVFSTSCLGGVVIGIPVKTKKLSSPEALNVPEGKQPLLVSYDVPENEVVR